ncbi:phosphotransferase enzyme family protein [Flavilitoribacter nigricans]|uniref:Aminoglycoside phosphotransferase domain-containing protein n=1 Tax=Flavilitoribacter nigricans (strain ATCC 23147 / DSM 23189 / NBRC 102662 / NCIMB 1420 / SS-2) TaxID=1122177 RepID=A0A2D0N260_FLAN2|nr:phosphotransferase [Flavilitoribacter nigricans]PHN02500.1 hypothetical protein CRP01_31480 [Flavilitoribacter nigricans DSM 23189 = NBRC 102662]
MTHAPALSSIITPDHLAEFATEHYDLPQPLSCRILKTGMNHSYLLRTPKERYVLRVYYKDWRTQTEIAEELRLINTLKAGGIRVAFPIPDTWGNFIQRIMACEGERYVVLFSYAPGESVRQPSETACHQLGLTMARMHQITLGKSVRRISYDADTLIRQAYELACSRFSESLPEMRYFRRAAARIEAEFGAADPTDLRYGVVHLDLWYENMKIRQDSEITIFDFDNCGNGWLFLDIAYSLMLLFRTEPDREIYRRRSDHLLRAYGSICPISAEEMRLLPFGGLAIWLHYTGIHVRRFDDFSNQFFSETFLKFWIDTVNRWMKFNDITI